MVPSTGFGGEFDSGKIEQLLKLMKKKLNNMAGIFFIRSDMFRIQFRLSIIETADFSREYSKGKSSVSREQPNINAPLRLV